MGCDAGKPRWWRCCHCCCFAHSSASRRLLPQLVVLAQQLAAPLIDPLCFPLLSPRAPAACLQRRQGWVDGKLVGPVASLDDFRGKVTSVDSCCCSPAGGVADGKTCAAGSTSRAGSQAAGPAAAAWAGPQPGSCGESLALLAAACSDGTVRVVDLASLVSVPAEDKLAAAAAGAPLLEMTLPEAGGASGGDGVGWHASAVQQASNDRNLVALAPDGSLLAVVGPDCRIHVLDVEGGGQAQQALALAAHSRGVRALRWLGCGLRLLSAGEDGVARIWQAAPAPT